MKEHRIDASMIHEEVDLTAFCEELNALLARSGAEDRVTPVAGHLDGAASPADTLPDALWLKALQRAAEKFTIPGLGELTTSSPGIQEGIPVLRVRGEDLHREAFYPGRTETAGDVVRRVLDAGQLPDHARQLAERFLEEG